MAITYTELGYSEQSYGGQDYLAEARTGADRMQFLAVITQPEPLGAQFEANPSKTTQLMGEFLGDLEKSAALMGQFEANPSKTQTVRGQFLGTLDAGSVLGGEFNANLDATERLFGQFLGNPDQPQALAAQFNADVSHEALVSGQFEANLQGAFALGAQALSRPQQSFTAPAQFLANLEGAPFVGAQFDGLITDQSANLGSEWKWSVGIHSNCGSYLAGDYAVGDYLANLMCVFYRAQFTAGLTKSTALMGQFEAVIEDTVPLAAQFLAELQATVQVGAQFTSSLKTSLAAQFRSVLYNIINLRVLCDFDSRGVDGLSWTANSTATGHFGANNLNTDIVEERWRSATGVKSGIRLECDTGLPQGVFTDTLAILSHNLTTSADVFLQGSDDAGFGTIGFSQRVTIERDNAYWLSPDLPTDGYRYWRLTIDDASNANDYLEIGVVLFGTATIFQGECFANPVRFGRRHFKDQVMTEGFTNVSNDRGIKRFVGLKFQNLNALGGNYANLVNLFETYRTTHKCLWIPTPQYPSRFAVFGKLSDLPEESHNDLGETNDYVDFDVEVDESL